MGKLRNFLIGAGIAAAGGVGTKLAVDYFRNRGKEEEVEESEVDPEPTSEAEVAYANVEDSSVQEFLDTSFGAPGRYVPTRSPKVFDYQGQQYMVIWAYDNEKEKNQMLAFLYTDAGRQMVASVGYTAEAADYNLNLEDTPFAVEINGEQMTSGQGETDGTEEVDFVPAGA
ncbi:MAG: hypothetical protein F6K36_00570 [Symploca sp. SIO3C6]|uniref:Uncharacterized protein n=1 Tax=Symploca sp. SIO1C4 TaxID=2607765 RepID=A0A6B3NA94_9CYAN|nr:hypothetical protein [Symploca sp. SIO3C6]NER26098.1 hypothetical protein [Symploca sp. SIO1C4]NET06233.1 hypothetical protein [Symploca sp. SIO2B6]NET54408.1 hypothetical protein [Merismopedia sp. SIO2A8]